MSDKNANKCAMPLDEARKLARQMREIISAQGSQGFLRTDLALIALLDAVDGAEKAEREACAHVAETMDFGGPYLNTGPDYKQGKIMAARQIAEAIRAR